MPTYNYEQVLDLLYVDPYEADPVGQGVPKLVWFPMNDPRETRLAQVKASGANTYAFIAGLDWQKRFKPLGGGFTPMRQTIVTTLYTPPLGSPPKAQSDTQIWGLFKALLFVHQKVTACHEGTEFETFDLINATPPHYDSEKKGLRAIVTHLLKFNY